MDETIINGIIEASQEVIGQLQYAMGVKGDTGDSGVYIGTTPPTDPNIKVWIDTSEESGDVEMTSNKVTSISSESTDIQYPSAKAVAEAIDPRTVYQKFIDDNNLKQRKWVDLSFVGGEYYYTDFLQAVADVNADTTVNSTTDSTNAVCQIFKNDEITVLRLLSDLSVTTEVMFEKSVILDINGFTINLNGNGLFGDSVMSSTFANPIDCTLVFYGAKLGSKVVSTDCLYMITFLQKYMYLLGGRYELISTENYTISSFLIWIYLESTSDTILEVINTDIYINSSVQSEWYGHYGIYIAVNDTYNHDVNIYSTKMYGYSTNDYTVCINSGKTKTITNPNIFIVCERSKFITISPANIGDNASAAVIPTAGNIKLKDCYIEGMSGAIQSGATLYLDNCICKSPAHGGFYNLSNGVAYLINSEFHRNPTTEGYTPTGTAAAYFGYGSIAYIDGCSFILDIDGDTSHGIAIKQGDTTEPTYVYMSNCELPKLRCDSGQYVYLGEGISDTIRNTTVNGTKVLTDENYSTYINKETGQPVIDIEYEPTSRSPQSGIAVAEAVVEAKDYTDTKIGDINSALDNIISLQNSYMGGNS